MFARFFSKPDLSSPEGRYKHAQRSMPCVRESAQFPAIAMKSLNDPEADEKTKFEDLVYYVTVKRSLWDSHCSDDSSVTTWHDYALKHGIANTVYLSSQGYFLSTQETQWYALLEERDVTERREDEMHITPERVSALQEVRLVDLFFRIAHAQEVPAQKQIDAWCEDLWTCAYDSEGILVKPKTPDVERANDALALALRFQSLAHDLSGTDLTARHKTLAQQVKVLEALQERLSSRDAKQSIDWLRAVFKQSIPEAVCADATEEHPLPGAEIKFTYVPGVERKSVERGVGVSEILPVVA